MTTIERCVDVLRRWPHRPTVADYSTHREPDDPSVAQIIRAAGSWNSALEAAGWEPPPRGKRGPSPVALDCAQLYREGCSLTEIAAARGISRERARQLVTGAMDPDERKEIADRNRRHGWTSAPTDAA